MMDPMNKPLSDWELSCLAERLSPWDFDQIAMRYLAISKVRLAQCRDDAGRNCITYMANSLIMWKKSQPKNQARKILYKKLTKAAEEQGLLERTSFRFLVTGEEEDGDLQSSWQHLANQTEVTKRQFGTFYTLILFLMALVPTAVGVVCVCLPEDFYVEILGNYEWASMSMLVWLMVLSLLSLFIIIVSFVFECYVSVKGRKRQRAYVTHDRKERCRNTFRLSLRVAVICLMYFTMAAAYLSKGRYYWNYKLDGYDIDHLHENANVSMHKYRRDVPSKYYDGLQDMGSCGGIVSYKDWEGILAQGIPDACKIKYDCGRYYRVQNINIDRCIKDMINSAEVEVRYETRDFQTYCFVVGSLSIVFGILLMYCSMKQFCSQVLCCKVTLTFPEDDERHLIESDDEFGNGNENIANADAADGEDYYVAENDAANVVIDQGNVENGAANVVENGAASDRVDVEVHAEERGNERDKMVPRSMAAGYGSINW